MNTVVWTRVLVMEGVKIDGFGRCFRVKSLGGLHSGREHWRRVLQSGLQVRFGTCRF